jgi:hypothetical protein
MAAKAKPKKVGSLLSAPQPKNGRLETAYQAGMRTAAGVCKGEMTKEDVKDALLLLKAVQKQKLDAIQLKNKAAQERIKMKSESCKQKKT